MMRIVLLVICIALLQAGRVYAAGGLVGEAGSCMVEFGFYTAHISVYQPETSGSEVLCEELPDDGETIFVLDYLHDGLKKVPLEFRLITDVADLGQFTRWEHIEPLGDLDPYTLFLQSPTIHASGSVTIEHDFSEPGYYIAIITAPHPSKDIEYRAVVPFAVGRPQWGFWPVVLTGLALLYGAYAFANGGWSRLRNRLVSA